jgi:hypothetical protein
MEYQMDTRLRSLLAELLASSQDRNDHFKRFPGERNYGRPYVIEGFDEETVKQDWSRVMRRWDSAIDELLRYSKEMVEVIEQIHDGAGL